MCTPSKTLVIGSFLALPIHCLGLDKRKTGHLFSAGYDIVHGPAIRYLQSQGTLRTSTPPVFAHSKNETQLRSVFVHLDRPLPSVCQTKWIKAVLPRKAPLALQDGRKSRSIRNSSPVQCSTCHLNLKDGKSYDATNRCELGIIPCTDVNQKSTSRPCEGDTRGTCI